MRGEIAGVAKLADAPGLGPGPEKGGGSSPLARTDTPDPGTLIQPNIRLGKASLRSGGDAVGQESRSFGLDQDTRRSRFRRSALDPPALTCNER